MKHILFVFLLLPILLFAQYPNSPNKSRLGYQTTGDGLIWRGVAADTVTKPRTTANAYFQLDTVNRVLRRYIATQGSWQVVAVTPDLTPYLLKSDTATMLLKYPSTVGFGILKSAKTIRADSTKLATRFYTNSTFFPIQGGTLTGTGGAGFIGLPSQFSAPGTPASGLNIYAQGSSFNWKGTDGYERLFASTLTGGRTYTLPNISGTFALGTGTANLVPLWTATNTLGSSNIQDNNTAVSILNSKPFQLGQWTTAGRPSGTSGYTGWNTTLTGIDWYNGTRWATGLESTFARGTATRVPFFDANGQVTESANYSYSTANQTLNLTTTNTGLFLPSLTVTVPNPSNIVGDGIHVLSPSMANGKSIALARFGKAVSTNNAGIISYFHSSDGSTNNYYSFGLQGSNTEMRVYPNRASFISAPVSVLQGALEVVPTGTSLLFYPTINMDKSDLPINSIIYQSFGRSSTSGNRGTLGFFYAGDNNASNRIQLGLHGYDANALQIFSSGQLVVNGALRVTGTSGAATNILGRNGSGDVSNLSLSNLSITSGIITAQNIYNMSGTLTANRVVRGANRRLSLYETKFTPLLDSTNNVIALISRIDTTLRKYGSFASKPFWGARGSSTIIGGNFGADTSTIFKGNIDGSVFIGTDQGYIEGGFNSFWDVVIGHGAKAFKDEPKRTVVGAFAKAIASDGTAIGYLTTAGLQSTAVGTQNTAGGVRSFAFGGFSGGNVDSTAFWGWNINTGNLSVKKRQYYYGISGGVSNGTQAHHIMHGKFSIGLDSAFSYNPVTDILQLSKYGTNATTAAAISKTESGYLASFATDGTVLSRAANTERYNTITSTTSPQTLSSTIADNLINQGGTQATFTFRLPASPVEGQISKATFRNAVTALTIDGNGTTITGTLPTSAAVGQQIVFKNYTGLGWVRQL